MYVCSVGRSTGLKGSQGRWTGAAGDPVIRRYTGLAQRSTVVKGIGGKGGGGKGGSGGGRGGRGGKRGSGSELVQAACNSTSVCDDYVDVLTLALTPDAYSSNNTADTGGAALIAPAGDQGACLTAVGFVGAAAAEAAIAAKLRRDWSVVGGISEQDVSFCRHVCAWWLRVRSGSMSSMTADCSLPTHLQAVGRAQRRSVQSGRHL